jgi:hypothetical protein
VEKSEEHGSIFVFNCVSLHKCVLGSECRLLPFVNSVLDKSDWFASRSDRCEPSEGALCILRWDLELVSEAVPLPEVEV